MNTDLKSLSHLWDSVCDKIWSTEATVGILIELFDTGIYIIQFPNYLVLMPSSYFNQ